MDAPSENSQNRSSIRFPYLWLPAALLIFVLAVGAWIILVRSLAGDMLFAGAEGIYESLGENRTLMANLTPSVPGSPKKQALLRQADNLVAHALPLDPVSARALLVQTKNLSLEKKYPEAMAYAQRARRALSSKESFIQIAWISLEMNKRADAREYFQRALAINPADVEALERTVWISKLDLNQDLKEKNWAARPAHLSAMLDGLWALQRYAYFNPNLSYLWSQYWFERTLTSKNYLHYMAGFRAAALADNRPVPKDRPLLFNLSDPMEIAKIANFFIMGSRGLGVVTSGKVFLAKRPVNTSKIRLD